VDRKTFAARLAELYPKVGGHLALQDGPAEIRAVGVISGAAAQDVLVAAAEGLDTFVTGEPAERLFHLAREVGLNVYACGHHATERIGVEALGSHLAERFGIEARFADVPNPI
jgi:putative NIF3 family GTP cyclohydrolase 1 type 2